MSPHEMPLALFSSCTSSEVTDGDTDTQHTYTDMANNLFMTTAQFATHEAHEEVTKSAETSPDTSFRFLDLPAGMFKAKLFSK